MKVKPAPGRSVRDPTTKLLLPPEGREVRDGDPFWARRIRDGDVIVDKGDPPPAHRATHTRHEPLAEKKEV